jgi:hypothetical protein
MKRSGHFIGPRDRIPSVDLVEIDMISLQPSQRIFTGAQNIIIRGIGVAAGRLGEFPEELGRDRKFIAEAIALHQNSQLLFGIAVTVGIGGIEEVDAVINRGVNGLLPWFQSDFTPKGRAQLPAAKTDPGNVKVGVAKLSVLHDGNQYTLPVKFVERLDW